MKENENTDNDKQEKAVATQVVDTQASNRGLSEVVPPAPQMTSASTNDKSGNTDKLVETALSPQVQQALKDIRSLSGDDALAVKIPEGGLATQQVNEGNKIQISYNSKARPDHLELAQRDTVDGVERLSKTYSGRNDGLQNETIKIGSSSRSSERNYNGRADGLTFESSNEENGSKTNIRKFSDGTQLKLLHGADGTKKEFVVAADGKETEILTAQESAARARQTLTESLTRLGFSRTQEEGEAPTWRRQNADKSIVTLNDQGKLVSAQAKDGSSYLFDSQQRLSQSTSAGVQAKFEYENDLAVTPKTAQIEGKTFTISQQTLGNEKTLLLSVHAQLTDKLPTLDGALHPSLPNATVRLLGDDGKLNGIVRPDGTKLQFGFAPDSNSLPGQLKDLTILRGDKSERWSTTNGTSWQKLDDSGKATGETWEGLKSIDEKSGQLTETALIKHQDGNLDLVTTQESKGKPVEIRKIDLDVTLKTINEATASNWKYNSRAQTNADLVTRQLADKTPAELKLLAKAFDPQNPQALAKHLEAKFKELPAGSHQWTEASGHLKRTGAPGELQAIQLAVDAAKANNPNSDKSKSAPQQSTRLTLLSATEQERKDIDKALGNLYGKEHALSNFYTTGPGKALINSGYFGSADQFTKAVTDLAAHKGRDQRTPQEQAELLNLALKNKNIDGFREAASQNVLSPEGRQAFIASGGEARINANPQGRGGTYIFNQEQRRELNELARDGRESPLSQFKRSLGVTFGNADGPLLEAVNRVSEDPRARALYLDGRELANSKTQPTSEIQKQSLEYYKEWQNAFSQAHYRSTDRKVDRYDALIVNPKGTIAAGNIFDQGGHWLQNKNDLYRAVEKASPAQLNTIFDGATNKDGKIQSSGLSDASRALAHNVNNKAVAQELSTLLTQKLEFGAKLGLAADQIGSTSAGAPLPVEALQTLKQNVPSFKTILDSQLNSIAAGYTLDRALREGAISPSQLSAEQKLQHQAFAAIDSDQSTPQGQKQFKAFLQGREVQALIDKTISDPDKSASVKDFAHSELLKGLEPDQRQNLETFRELRNEAVQTNVQRSLEKTIKDSEGDPARVLEALENATPQEQARLKDNAEGYKDKITALIQKPKSDPLYSQSLEMGTALAMQRYSQGQTLTQADHLSLEILSKAAQNGDYISGKETLQVLTQALRKDQDGSLTKELSVNPDFKKLIDTTGGTGQFDRLVKPTLDSGAVPPAVWKQVQSYFGSGEGVFKDALINASPRELQILNKSESQKEREGLLAGLTKEQADIAQNILKQNQVNPEDKLRAYITGTGNEEEVLEGLKEMSPDDRARHIQAYHNKYGSNLQEDLLGKVAPSNRSFVSLLTGENKLTTEQALTKAKQEVVDTNNTFLGGLARRYDTTPTQLLDELSRAARESQGILPAEKLDQQIKGLTNSLKSFEGTKEQTKDLIVESAVTVLAATAAPFSGGSSLSMLTLTARFGSVAARGGLGGALLSEGLTQEGSLSKFAGNTLKYAALAGGTTLGAEGLVVASRLGGRVAFNTVERALSESTVTGLPKEALATQLKSGLSELVEKGLTAGGVKDEAIKGLVKGLEGLTPEAQQALSEALIKNLSTSVREVSKDSIKGLLTNTARIGRTASLDGLGAYSGDVAGDLARQLVDRGSFDLRQSMIGGINSFLFASFLRPALEGGRALHSAVAPTREAAPHLKVQESPTPKSTSQAQEARLAPPDHPTDVHAPRDAVLAGTLSREVGTIKSTTPIQSLGASEQFVKDISKLTDKLPDELTQLVKDGKVKLIVAGSIEDYHGKADFLNNRPHGYAEGSTWYNARAFYKADRKELVIFENYKKAEIVNGKAVSHADAKTTAAEHSHILDHELTHAWDYNQNRAKFSDNVDFQRAVIKDYAAISKGLKDGTLDKEMVARRLSYYLGDGGYIIDRLGLSDIGKQPHIQLKNGGTDGKHTRARAEVLADTVSSLRGSNPNSVEFLKLFPNSSQFIKQHHPEFLPQVKQFSPLENAHGSLQDAGLIYKKTPDLGETYKNPQNNTTFRIENDKVTSINTFDAEGEVARAVDFSYGKDGKLKSVYIGEPKIDQSGKTVGVDRTFYTRTTEGDWQINKLDGKTETVKHLEFEITTSGQIKEIRTTPHDRSVAISQSRFREAVEKNAIIEAEKKPVQVQVRRVDNPDGELLPTNENQVGQKVPQGKWVITRLNPDGTPFVLENTGKVDQWPKSAQGLAEAYDLPEDVLKSGSGTVWSKPGFVGRFVKLEKPTDIVMRNGDVLHGEKGDYLFNHNFDSKTNTPGDSYAIVGQRSFDASYKPIDVRSQKLATDAVSDAPKVSHPQTLFLKPEVVERPNMGPQERALKEGFDVSLSAPSKEMWDKIKMYQVHAAKKGSVYADVPNNPPVSGRLIFQEVDSKQNAWGPLSIIEVEKGHPKLPLSNDPIKLSRADGMLYADGNGNVFIKKEDGTLAHQPHLLAVKPKDVQLREIEQLKATFSLDTEGAIAAHQSRINANINSRTKLLEELNNAPEVGIIELIGGKPRVNTGLSMNTTFNPNNGSENCMAVTAAIVRTLREEKLHTSLTVPHTPDSFGTEIGPPHAGKFTDRIDALSWFDKASGRRLGAPLRQQELSPGKDYAMTFRLNENTDHMVFAHKNQNGQLLIYDGQRGVRISEQSLKYLENLRFMEIR